jgi:HicB family
MDLSPYVDALRDDLAAAAAAGTEEAQATARLLTAALDSSLRLCLVDALSALAAEVTASSDLEVEIRMHGREPQLVVVAQPPPDGAGPDRAASPDDNEEGGTARITLRLPESLKGRAEEQAARDGLSVNAWLVRAVSAALRPGPSTRGPRRTTGFARG